MMKIKPSNIRKSILDHKNKIKKFSDRKSLIKNIEVFQFFINTGKATYDTPNKLIVIPFNAAFKNTEKLVEKECEMRWPELLSNTREFNMNDLENLQKMKEFIINGLSEKDTDGVFALFHDKGWLYPFNRYYVKFAWIDIEDVNCKYWLTPEEPMIQISGVFYFDIKDYITTMFKNKFITMDLKIVDGAHTEALIHFVKDIAVILQHVGRTRFQKITSDLILSELKNKRSDFSVMLMKEFIKKYPIKAKRISAMPGIIVKKIQFINNKTLSLVVKTPQTIIDWIKSNKLLAAGAGLFAYNAYKKSRTR